jgi:hypothetical protein
VDVVVHELALVSAAVAPREHPLASN